jgi:hypothetical protein
MTYKDRISLQRTVLYDEESGSVCMCQGDYWKTCALRVSQSLPCQETLITLTAIDRTEKDPAGDAVRSIDKSLAKLTDSMRSLNEKFKVF